MISLKNHPEIIPEKLLRRALHSIRELNAEAGKSRKPENKVALPPKTGINTVLAQLRCCSRSRDLQGGIKLHELARSSGIDSNMYISSALVNMYARCGSLQEAQKLFDTMPQRDVVSWTSLLLGFAEFGHGGTALELLEKMEEGGCAPNDRTLVAAAKACSSLAIKGDKPGALEKGREIHRRARELGFESDVYVAGSLVDMFFKCGSMKEAREVFERLSRRDMVIWTSFMLGLVESREFEAALEAFERMKSEGCVGDARSHLAALKACGGMAGKDQGKFKLEALRRGVEIHRECQSRGFESDAFVSNTLVDMYSKCGDMRAARGVFDRAPRRDIISWNVLMQGYAENDEEEVALELFWRMQAAPNGLSFVAALKACTGLAGKEEGKRMNGKVVKLRALEKSSAIHQRALQLGLESEILVANTLIDMYSNCGSMDEAQKVFSKISHRTPVSWNNIILGYAENGEGDLALELFTSMQEFFKPNARTFVAALKACCGLAAREDSREMKKKLLEKGGEIHKQVVEAGFGDDVFLSNMLVDLYSKCGSMGEARRVFDGMSHARTVVTWTALMLGYSEGDDPGIALGLLEKMNHQGECSPNALTYAAAVKSCLRLVSRQEEEAESKPGYLDRVKIIHEEAGKLGYESDPFLANLLVEFYLKCGSLPEARELFRRLKVRSSQTCASMISGLVENSQAEAALETWEGLRDGERDDDRVTTAALKAFGSTGKIAKVRRLHSGICRRGTEGDTMVATCLIDVYGKCGAMVASQLVFDSLRERDSVSWTALLAGYSRQGQCQRVFEAFEEMIGEGVRADDVSLVCLLTACGHAGLVERGRGYFEGMEKRFGVKPSLEHYVCMVDLLGRSNRVGEAVEMVNSMPFRANAVVWMVVLGACQKWKNVGVGRMAFERVVELDENAAAYVLMGNIYGSAGMWEEKAMLEARWRGKSNLSLSTGVAELC